jgi:hypothetical protein
MRLARFVWKLAKFVTLGVLGFVALGAMLFTAAGILMTIPAPKTEITRQKPYADFVGREYRVVARLTATAWNDYPDKATIRAITLDTPGEEVRNRYVSYVRPVQPGQRVRIVSAWRYITPFGFHPYYVVVLPGAGLPEGTKVEMHVDSDGIPAPQFYEPIHQ